VTSANHSAPEADPNNFENEGGGRQCISPVVIYRKYTQRTIGLLHGKKWLIEKKFRDSRGADLQWICHCSVPVSIRVRSIQWQWTLHQVSENSGPLKHAGLTFAKQAATGDYLREVSPFHCGYRSRSSCTVSTETQQQVP